MPLERLAVCALLWENFIPNHFIWLIQITNLMDLHDKIRAKAEAIQQRNYIVESIKQKTHIALSTQLAEDRAAVRLETKCALAKLGYTMRCRVRQLIPFMDKLARLVRSLPPEQKDWERRNILKEVYFTRKWNKPNV